MVIVFKDLSIVGYLKYYCRNGERRINNYEVSIFMSSREKQSIHENTEAMKKLRLDKHNANVYLIASRALSILNNSIKT
ncbi:MAG: hypothetical protein QXH73_05250 [Ignisphaera sp.]